MLDCGFCSAFVMLAVNWPNKDYCVWSMNYETITRKVNLMRGGIWRTLYSDHGRREIGCKLAIYIMNNGYGRQCNRKEVPRCVLQQLSEKWPE